jgi:hypothetical protein
MLLSIKVYLIYFYHLLYVLICITFIYEVRFVYYLSLNNKYIIIMYRYLEFKFIIYMIIGNNE